MLIKKTVSVIFALSILTITVDALASFRPYVGIDAQKRRMYFEEGYGQNLFKHRYPQNNFYLGLLFNKFFGIELGYYKTLRLDSLVALKPGDNNLGFPLDMFDDYTLVVRSKLKAKHANFVFFLPISERLNLDFIATVGLSKLKLILSKDLPIDQGIPNPDLLKDHQDFTQTYWIPRINLGLQQAITERFSVRFLLGW